MYQCPVNTLIAPFHDQLDAVHVRISEQAAAWVRPLLKELSRSLPGRRLDYGDDNARFMLPGVLITPPVISEGRTLHLLEDVLEHAPKSLKRARRAKEIDDLLRDAGVKICDRFGGIGEVSFDPDEDVQTRGTSQ